MSMLRRRPLVWAVLIALVPVLAYAQGIVVKSGAGSDLATIDGNKNVRVSTGASTRQTFSATISGATTTAAYNLQIEASASTGFKVIEICVGYAQGATAAGTIVTTTVSRRTSASSGGTALTNNGTGTTSITDMSTSGAGYGGLARGMAATLGSAGATIDQWSFRQSVLGATTGIEGVGDTRICQQYGSAQGGGKAIEVAAGTSNGVAVNVSAGGAGSVAVGSIRVTFIVE